MVEAKTMKAVDRRLARLEGQIGGLRRMVAEDRYCIDILTQLAAARSALDQVGAELAASHVQTCMLGHKETPHEATRGMSEEDLVEELRETLSRLMR
jgi:DNA-binding FrmR family transcriptional regulator